MNIKKITGLFIIILIAGMSQAQIISKGIPYIKNFSRAEYDGNNQTLAIVQDNRGLMYFANQYYILEFDGKTWRKIFIPGDPNIFAMAKDSAGRIYIGAGVGEIGYLEPDQDGTMKYKSLKDKIPADKKEFSLARAVLIAPDNSILFITPMSIYVYKNETFKIIEVEKPEDGFIDPFFVNGKLYIQEKGKGILEYVNGELKFLKGTEELFANKWVKGMYPLGKNDLYITTFQDSTFVFSGGKSEFAQKDPLFSNIYCSTVYDNQFYVGGLYGKGVIIFDKDLKIVKHINLDNGLKNNIIFSVYVDKDKNIWLGTNDGISVIYANSPYTVFSASSGITENVMSTILYKNYLFAGTSKGVFYKDFHEQNSVRGGAFQIIDKPQTQVWKIDTIHNHLLCASSIGLYDLSTLTGKLIGQDLSVKDFVTLKSNNKIIIATGGGGLTVYEFVNDNLEFKRTVKNFNFKGDFRHLVEDNEGYFWITDRSKGVFRIKFNSKMDSVIDQKEFAVEDGLPDILNNYVFEINNDIIFTTKDGVYNFDKTTNKFVKNPEFEKIFEKGINIMNLYQSPNGDIWYKEELEDPKIKNKKHWELGLLKYKDGNYDLIKTPFYKVRDRINSINQISENELIVGTEAGFVHYNLDVKKNYEESYDAMIRKVEFIKNDSLLFGGSFVDESNKEVFIQNAKRIPQIPFGLNDLRFSFSSIFYEEPEKTQYKFILKGNDTEWSDWKYVNEKEYSNLGPGTYTFIVKARNLYNVESNTAEFTFEILPPWYRTVWAYIGYVILFGLFIFGLIQLSISRVKKQREYLKRVVEERTKEIKMQKEEIEAKNSILSEQNEEINQKNISITASINYAKRIQESILPLKEKIIIGLPENFILFKPRDIVSGDFYWYAEKGDKIVYTAVDCTGHGVPGALMSMIGSENLTKIVNSGVLRAAEILEQLNDNIVKILKQDKEGLSQDGMDIALLVIDKANKTVEYAGAKNPLVYITNGELFEVKASRSGIGGYQHEKKIFEGHFIKYESPTWFYLFTDGFQDQFGGPQNRKYMIKRMKEKILDIHYKPMAEQHDILKNEIDEWMAGTFQTDDILLTAIKL
jgi:serine phosphatase RsbU (regulator of sigma subunit)